MLINLIHTLTAHEAECYFQNYPDRATWYINNHFNIHDKQYAQRNYSAVVTRLHGHPNLNCVLPSDSHIKVQAALQSAQPKVEETPKVVTTQPATTMVISPKTVGTTTVVDQLDNSKGATLKVDGGLKGTKEVIGKINNKGTTIFGSSSSPLPAIVSPKTVLDGNTHQQATTINPFNSGIFNQNSDSNPFN